jgi:opacity protein-like surface antigen
MRRTLSLAVIAASMVLGSPAAAQFRTTQQGSGRPISFAFGGGASVPIGDYKNALKTGWNGQGSIIFNFAGLPLALRADLNYNKFTFKSDLPFSPSGSTSGGTITTTDDLTQQIIGGLANITIPLRMGPLTPYVTAGLAGFNIKTKLSEVQSTAEDESETKFAVNGGAGFSLRLLGASAFIEAKINNVYADKKFISNKELKALQFVPITFGFVF